MEGEELSLCTSEKQRVILLGAELGIPDLRKSRRRKRRAREIYREIGPPCLHQDDPGGRGKIVEEGMSFRATELFDRSGRGPWHGQRALSARPSRTSALLGQYAGWGYQSGEERRALAPGSDWRKHFLGKVLNSLRSEGTGSSK